MNRLWIVSFVFLTACSGLWSQQDPLNAKSDLLDTTVKPTPPVGAPKPTPSDSVQIDTNSDEYTFQEGQAGEITISSRVLIQDYVTSIEIQNLSEFPGAKFDAASGHFTWTPPAGFVENDRTRVELDVFVSAVPKEGDGAKYSRERKIKIEVTKQFSEPTILSSTSPTSIREEGSQTFKVVVSDVDGGTDPKQYPILQILPPTGSARNLSPFVYITDVKPGAKPKEWEFRMRIDLRGVELVNATKEFGFALQAISRFQKASAVGQYVVRVTNKPAEPANTWAMTEFEAENDNTVNFLIVDTRGETKLAVDNSSGFPTGATFSCSSLDQSTLNCQVKWKPEAGFAGKTGLFSVRIVSTNKDFMDSFSITSYLSLPYKVKARPQIPVPPQPPTNPPTQPPTGPTGGR